MYVVRRTSLAALLLVVAVGSRATAGPIHVDGHWSDWGINPNSGDWNASVGSRVFFEDYVGTDGVGAISPGYGGQYFDVEAIYALRHGTFLDFAIVTGFDPDGVRHLGTNYSAGDIFLDVGAGWNVGLDLQTGNLYTNATHSNPTIFTASGPLDVTGGTLVGAADLSVPFDGHKKVYSGPSSHTNKHYLFEGSVDLSLVGGVNTDTGIHWTMSCGNDVGIGYIPKPNVPEPATVGLLGLGGVIAAIRSRKNRK